MFLWKYCRRVISRSTWKTVWKQSQSRKILIRTSHTALNAARQPKTARNLTIMKEQNSEEEVMKILDDIPNGRRALLENYDNLLNVAEYCNNNYTQVLLLQPTDGVACYTSNQLCAKKPDFPVTSTTLTWFGGDGFANCTDSVLPSRCHAKLAPCACFSQVTAAW